MKTITRRTFGAFALAASTMLASGTAYAADAIKVGLLVLLVFGGRRRRRVR